MSAHLRDDGPFAWRPEELVAPRPELVAPGILRTPLVTPAGCARFADELERRRAAAPAAPPNSMHEHGAQLAPLGLDGAAEQLLGLPSFRALLADAFADHGGGTLDGWHAYLVEYARGLDEELGFHVDDSEVTLNLCLGDRFSGSELVLLGRRCALHRQTAVDPGEVLELDHEPGTAILHAGAHRHRVDPLLRGRRRNLIVWFRSAAFRASGAGERCAPWCGAAGSGGP